MSLVALICVANISLMQGALYTETFDNTTSGNLKAGDLGWSAFVGSSALNVTNVAGVTGMDYVAGSLGAGSPASPTGFLFANNGATANQTFGLVDTFTSGLSLTSGDTISWRMGNNLTSATAQILIQIGGDGTVGSGTWYVSTMAKSNSSTFSTSTFSQSDAATIAAVSFSLTFDPSASNWKNFTLSDGVSMSVGSALATPLSSTTITGIGFYLVDGAVGNTMRFDTLQIIPEPSVQALAGMGGLFLLLGLRRQARQRIRYS